MQTIDFYCPYCGLKTSIPTEVQPLGKKKACKGCQQIFILSPTSQIPPQRKAFLEEQPIAPIVIQPEREENADAEENVDAEENADSEENTQPLPISRTPEKKEKNLQKEDSSPPKDFRKPSSSKEKLHKLAALARSKSSRLRPRVKMRDEDAEPPESFDEDEEAPQAPQKHPRHSFRHEEAQTREEADQNEDAPQAPKKHPGHSFRRSSLESRRNRLKPSANVETNEEQEDELVESVELEKPSRRNRHQANQRDNPFVFEEKSQLQIVNDTFGVVAKNWQLTAMVFLSHLAILPFLIFPPLIPLVTILVALLAQGAIFMAIASSYLGKPIHISFCLRVAFRQMGRMILGSFLVFGIPLLIVSIPVLVIVGVLKAASPMVIVGLAMGSPLEKLGIVVILILVVIFLILSVAITFYMLNVVLYLPILFVERRSIWQSFKRSFTLGKGFRMRILGTIFCPPILFSFIASIIWGIITTSLGTSQDILQQSVFFIFVSILVFIIMETFYYTSVAFVYFDLKIRKENFTQEELAQAFTPVKKTTPRPHRPHRIPRKHALNQ